MTEVIRTYLELRSRDMLRPAERPSSDVRIVQLEHPSAGHYLELYTRIGEPWHWRDRLAWSESQLCAYLASPDVSVFTIHVGHETAGFFELKRQSEDVVEIMYFGLDQRFIGQRLGGWMLTRAVEEAFDRGASRVILNTCTLDAPQALPNYLKRGFEITREERYSVVLTSPPATRSPTT